MKRTKKWNLVINKRWDITIYQCRKYKVPLVWGLGHILGCRGGAGLGAWRDGSGRWNQDENRHRHTSGAHYTWGPKKSQPLLFHQHHALAEETVPSPQNKMPRKKMWTYPCPPGIWCPFPMATPCPATCCFGSWPAEPWHHPYCVPEQGRCWSPSFLHTAIGATFT